MDPVAESNLNLNRRPSVALEEKTFNEIFLSTHSLNYYEQRSFKTVVPQIVAVVIVSVNNFLIGSCLAYSAVLLPQLQENNEINGTKSELSFIASSLSLSAPLGSFAAAYFMNRWGRIFTSKLSIIPGVIGWLLCATALNVPMMIISRFFTGFFITFCSGPAVVYITEIARDDLRGAFVSFGMTLASLGMLLIYLLGSLLYWRTIAFICVALTVIPFILLFFIPESPVWLVSHDRIEEARRAFDWFNKYLKQAPNGKTLTDKQIEILLRERMENAADAMSHKGGFSRLIRLYRRPTGYKPIIILIGLFLVQQFSGAYTFLLYSVGFLKAAGTEVDPYLASVGIAVVRAIMSLFNVIIMRSFKRRTLLIFSTIGMGVTILISGLFTNWINQGTTTLTWVPVACLLSNVLFSMFGLVPIPWTMTAEVFPLEIRSSASSFIMALANLLMFAAVQSYGDLTEFFGDHARLQWFFAAVCFIGTLYIIIVVPETHEKSLSDIEDYFKHSTIYLSCGKGERSVTKRDAKDSQELL